MNMKKRVGISVVGFLTVVAGVGCTEQHLEMNTELLAPTVSEIETDQMLDNLALFHERPYSLARQLIINTGGLQVSDQFNPSLKFPWASPKSSPGTLSYTKQWVENWSVTPVTDPNDLQRASYLYRRVANPTLDKGYFAEKARATTQRSTEISDTAVMRLDQFPDEPVKDKDGIVKDPKVTYFNTIPTVPHPSKWIMFDPEPEAIPKPDPEHPESTFRNRGTHGNSKIWATDAGLSQFFLLLQYVEMNTLKNGTPSGGAGPGGAPIHNQVFQQAL